MTTSLDPIVLPVERREQAPLLNSCLPDNYAEVGKLHATGLVTPIKSRDFAFKLDVFKPENAFFLVAGEPIPELSVLEGPTAVRAEPLDCP